MLYIYDIETYSNFFSATFKEYNTKEVKVFVICKGRDNTQELIKFIDNKNLWLAGYNNSHFDNQLLKYIRDNQIAYWEEDPKLIAQNIYEFAKKVVENDHIDHMYNLPFRSLDLMKIGNLNQKSLKLTGTIFKWHKLQDLPIPWDQEVKIEDMDEILKYNLNDVEITERLFELLEPQIKLRFNISKQYDINAYSQTDSGIANKLLEKFYSEATGLQPKQFKKWRTKRPRIGFWDVIFQDVYFRTPQFKEFLKEFRQSIFYPTHPFNKKSVIFDGMKYVYGVGGIHGSREGTIFQADENTEIIDYDFDSYYPNLMIKNNIYPQHLSPDLVNILKNVMEERLEAKRKAKDKRRKDDSRTTYQNKADTLKICINSVYGRLGFENGWLYDPLAMLKVTVNGQLYLTMLAEHLTMSKFKVIAINTDGLVTVVPKNRKQEYVDICNKFSEAVNITGEFTEYSQYSQSDVNNYISITTDGDVKTKGLFNVPNVNNIHKDTFMLRRGFDRPIIAIALNEFFKNNTPIQETILNHKDIYDFCTSKKTDKKFVNEFHHMVDGNARVDKLQQSVRYYVSTDGGSLYKKETESGKMINYCVGKRVTIFNDYFESEDYHIDYNYYIHETQKIIDEIIKPQLTLF